MILKLIILVIDCCLEVSLVGLILSIFVVVVVWMFFLCLNVLCSWSCVDYGWSGVGRCVGLRL